MSMFDAIVGKAAGAKFDAELDGLFASSKGKSAVAAGKPAGSAAPAKKGTPIAIPTNKKPAAPAKPAAAPAKAKPAPKPKAKAAPKTAPAPAAASESDEDDASDDSDDNEEADSDDDSEEGSDDEEAESGDDDAASEDGDDDAMDVEEAADADEAAPASAKKLTPKAIEKEKLQSTVFVGNVTIKASEKAVFKEFKALFAAFGKVKSIRFRSIAFTDALPRKLNFKLKNFHPERETCNAYVVMSSPKEARAATAGVNTTVFHEKHLRVDYCGKIDAKSDDADAPAVRRRDPKRCVFVGNVPFDVEDESLWKHFAQAGDVENVRVIRDAKTGLGKGFAYVQFKERASVPLAIKLHETDFNGKPLRVLKCHKMDDATGKVATPVRGGNNKKQGGKPSDKGANPKKRRRDEDGDDDGTNKSAKRQRKARPNRARTSEWKKGHDQKKRKAAKELPRKLAKKVRKLKTQAPKK
ncbi:Nucleolar protein 12 [Blastocladiella emersonii ATCC 22665]|nr:Nucleolar protein 12 [Blastocladiella emersonii ATCC 22665]